jgi:hypothetical protein
VCDDDQDLSSKAPQGYTPITVKHQVCTYGYRSDLCAGLPVEAVRIAAKPISFDVKTRGEPCCGDEAQAILDEGMRGRQEISAMSSKVLGQK